MVNEKFNDAYNQIPILMIASIFNVIIGLVSTVYIAKKDTKGHSKNINYYCNNKFNSRFSINKICRNICSNYFNTCSIYDNGNL